MEIQYYQIIQDMKTKFNFRYHVVEYAKTHSVTEAAREFQTTRKTVRKWMKRFKQQGLRGLEDQSESPSFHPS